MDYYSKHMIAGSVAGLVEHFTLLPIDVIKTHIQSGFNKNGFLHTAKNMGIKNSWRGWEIVFTGIIPSHASYFLAYEKSKQLLDIDHNYSMLNSTICGFTSVIAHDLIATPFDVCKQRHQINKNKYAMDTVHTIMKKNAIRSLYRSFPTTIFRNLPYGGIFMCINEGLRNQFEIKKNNPINVGLCSGIAGATAAIITNPLDVIKTKIQTQHGGNYPTFLSTMNQIYKKDWKIFYRGCSANVLIAIPSTAICWMTYEYISSIM